MPGKIKLIQITEQPKKNPFARAAAGVLLSGVLAASCAPELVHLESKSAISVAAAQPEKVAPGWKAFCEKHKLNDKEKAALSKLFLREHEKTGPWHSDIFDALMNNANVRKNHLESASRIISSVLQRTDDSANVSNALNAVSHFLTNHKLGGTEFSAALQIVEGNPAMDPDKILLIHKAASLFSSDNYSQGFSKLFQEFFFGGRTSLYLSFEDKAEIISSFSNLAANDKYSPEMLATISGIFEDFKESAPKFRKRHEEFVGKYFKNAPFEVPYSGPSTRMVASAILGAISNPRLDQGMLEDLRFELKFILSAEEGSGEGDIAEALSKIYGFRCFGTDASKRLRAHIGKKGSFYDLEKFLNSVVIVAEGRNFGRSDSYDFLSAYEELERAGAVIGDRNYSDTDEAAKIIASPRYSEKISKFLFFTLKKCKGGPMEPALNGISFLLENKEFSPELAGKLEKAYRRISRFTDYADAREQAFIQLSGILEKSKEDAKAMDNIDFMLNQKGAKELPIVSLMEVLLGRSSLIKDASLPSKLEKARSFAQRIGARHKDAEVCLNFAYALGTIGADKTKSLYERFGIEYFGRYPKELLEEVFLSEDPGRKQFAPIAFSVFNKSDWNGAFYKDGDLLSEFIKDYRVCLIEVDSERDFFEGLESFASKRMSRIGNHKIGALVLGGHGYSGGISFGSSGRGSSELTASDMRGLKELKGHFSENPTVILLSCSTGKNERSIGARISGVLGARLFAPKEPGSARGISFGPKGEVLDVHYSVNRSEFESGKMKKEEKK